MIDVRNESVEIIIVDRSKSKLRAQSIRCFRHKRDIYEDEEGSRRYYFNNRS